MAKERAEAAKKLQETEGEKKEDKEGCGSKDGGCGCGGCCS
ncbi:MAG: hypothetical protein PHR43_06960 [Dehalococcoidales bacterium]|nr:hypothetical protein [Dehalococcoidales bacterium]